MKPTIAPVPTDRADVFAFDISGEVQSSDMEFMAATMNDAFDRMDDVKILLHFRPYDGSEIGAVFDFDVMKAQFRSMKSVSKYAVVGLPESAASIIDFFDKLMPVDARTFDSHQETDAWEFVGAQPMAEATTG